MAKKKRSETFEILFKNDGIFRHNASDASHKPLKITGLLAVLCLEGPSQ